MKMPKRNTIQLILYFIRSYPKESTLAILALLTASFAETLGIGALLPLITIILGNETGDDNALANMLFQIYEWANIKPSLINLLITIVAAISLKAAIVFQAMKYVSYVATDVTRDFRISLINKLMRAEWGYFSNLSIGKTSNTISSEAARAGHCYLLFGRTLAAFLQVGIYVIAAFLISWQVSLIAIAMGAFIALIAKTFIKMSRTAGQNLTLFMNDMLAQVNDSLIGIKPIKAMGQEDHYVGTLNKFATQVMQAQKKQALSNQLLQIIYEPLAVALLAVGLFYILTYTNTPIASVLLLAFLFYRLLNNTNLLQNFYQNMVQNEAAVWGLINEIKKATDNKESLRTGKSPTLKKKIAIKNISINYDNNINVFSNFSTNIPAQKISVLFGPSGSGKTSLIDAILGLKCINSGEILIDNTPLSDINIKEWRKMIGYVPQETFLFHDSIRQNVTLGNENYSAKDIKDALKKSDALEFVERMGNSIDSIVGERGGKLSGGQRQRIALARALLRKPRVLILDEATSGLDHKTELQILETLQKLSEKITVIMISHNPSILDYADHIININNESTNVS